MWPLKTSLVLSGTHFPLRTAQIFMFSVLLFAIFKNVCRVSEQAAVYLFNSVELIFEQILITFPHYNNHYVMAKGPGLKQGIA